MLFNSFHFLLFFPIVVTLYFFLPHRYRWMFLLAASYYFYMCWRPEYVIVLILITLIDYYAGVQIAKTSIPRKRKKYLLLSLAANLGLLFVFKYFNFINASVKTIFAQLHLPYPVNNLDVLLPVGISFHTFQTMSYSIDVYQGKKQAERHCGMFALYVAFFPQLVAGPIERSMNLLPQFFEKHRFEYHRVIDGLKIMLWGFFKKVVIADRLAVAVNQVYNNPHDWQGWPVIMATYFFAFQIYCDFSGYSDIAIGAARVMGFNLSRNFHLPYFATSVADFWKRWHISLSTWFRDYLYIPLGGNRVTSWRWCYNILIVFLISGLWHGANWTFVIWGGLHGVYMLLSHFTQGLRKKFASLFYLDRFPRLHQVIKVVITFHLVTFSWIFFRANSLSDALLVLHNMTKPFQKELVIERELILSVVFLLFLFFVQLLQTRWSLRDVIAQWPKPARWLIYYAMIFLIIFVGKFDHQEFIYFQF
jgi:D-alanyl-lipoteichoic acid acyltransferase DltB (MBOAT superfamily)